MEETELEGEHRHLAESVRSIRLDFLRLRSRVDAFEPPFDGIYVTDPSRQRHWFAYTHGRVSHMWA
jgi:hypothetical protein